MIDTRANKSDGWPVGSIVSHKGNRTLRFKILGGAGYVNSNLDVVSLKNLTKNGKTVDNDLYVQPVMSLETGKSYYVRLNSICLPD